MRTWFLALSLLVGLAAAQSPSDDTLVIAQGVDVDTLEPAQVRSGHEFNIVRHIFATLLEVTPDGELIPYLAENYEVSEDGTEITFTLREGLTCHDGEALSADDVVYSFERAADPENAFNGNTPGFIYDSLGYARARVDGDLQATILLEQYQPIAPGLLAQVLIHCRDAYENRTLDEAAETPVGSGPYAFAEWVRDDHIVLGRAPDFGLREVTFDTLVWRVIPEASTRAAELVTGGVDLATNISPDQAEAINARGNAEVKAVQGTRRIYLGFNQRDVFEDTEGGAAVQETAVRVALQYAVDVPTICATLLGRPCERATGPANIAHPTLEPYPYDPEVAERLLDEAGYPRGEDGVRFAITLQAPNGRYLNDADVALAIGQYLTDIGVATKVELMDWVSAYQPLLREHNAGPLFLLGSGGVTWSPIYDMGLFASETAGANHAEWTNPEWQARWDRLAEVRDPEGQQRLVNEMLEIWYNDPPWLMLYFQPDFYGVSNRIDWEPRRDEDVSVYGVQLKE